jgi:hypothetical protein
MNINEKFFSFPPFLSIAWAHVAALSINRQGNIVVHMNSGESISLPELPEEGVNVIFKAHASFLENQVLNEPVFRHKKLPQNIKERVEGDFPLRFSFGTMDGLGSAMQHNPAQKNAPNLPEEMITKIAEVSRILAPNDPDQIPKPEPHCNCYHCQIARALNHAPDQEAERLLDEEVTVEELQFEQWEITQTGDKLFNVINKLDELENYSVHLGHPVGCTCGKQNCEHILAVLKS